MKFLRPNEARPAPPASPDKRNVSGFRALAAVIALFALFVFAVAALSSCKRNRSGDSDATNAGDEYIGGEGGEGGGGVFDDDADMQKYTQPTYTKETQEQLDKFQQAVYELTMDDVASATSLFQAFHRLAFDSQPNDALLFAYESAMQSLGESMNEDIAENGPPDQNTINSAIENGFMFVMDELSPHYALRPDFLYDTFYGFVSNAAKDWLALKKKHFEFAGGHDFLENDTIMVSLDQLAEMIFDWESYLKSRINIYNAADIKDNLLFYLRIYVGAYQIENSGFYFDNGVDINGDHMLKLADEPRQSYLRFIENYKSSEYWPMISELFQVYQSHDFLYTEDIEEFFDKHGLVVPT
jgi:hypothetical protein